MTPCDPSGPGALGAETPNAGGTAIPISTTLATKSEVPNAGTRAASSRLKNRTIEIFSNKITPMAMPRLMWMTVRAGNSI